jgi:RNA polymerase sigma-70 factor (ECF subfamily)
MAPARVPVTASALLRERSLMAVPASDEQLIAASRDEPEAFGELYDRHSRAIFGHLLRRTGSAEVAADLTAEVFAAALVARTRFVPGPAPVIAWLLGIANHKLVDARRRQDAETRARRRLGMERREFSDEQLERAEALVDLERSSRHGELRAALADLDEDQRAAVLARVADEADYSDLAARWGTTESVIRKRVSRGLSRLAHAMGATQ